MVGRKPESSGLSTGATNPEVGVICGIDTGWRWLESKRWLRNGSGSDLKWLGKLLTSVVADATFRITVKNPYIDAKDSKLHYQSKLSLTHIPGARETPPRKPGLREVGSSLPGILSVVGVAARLALQGREVQKRVCVAQLLLNHGDRADDVTAAGASGACRVNLRADGGWPIVAPCKCWRVYNLACDLFNLYNS